MLQNLYLTDAGSVGFGRTHRILTLLFNNDVLLIDKILVNILQGLVRSFLLQPHYLLHIVLSLLRSQIEIGSNHGFSVIGASLTQVNVAVALQTAKTTAFFLNVLWSERVHILLYV